MSEDVRGMVGDNVKRLRLLANISQAELAARLGVDRAYVSGLEKGARNPTIVTLWHVSKALDVDCGSSSSQREEPQAALGGLMG